jgi:hypothetical protein
MFNCCKRNKQHITKNNDTILRTLLDQLVELNITYNTEFNKISNELNKIKLILENNVIYELDSVRKNTHIAIYTPSKFIDNSEKESIRSNSTIELVLKDTTQNSIIHYV